MVGKGVSRMDQCKGKTKHVYKGHYQPKIPADLGYYDLRLPIIAEQQAELAKESRLTVSAIGIYWFGDGKVIKYLFIEL